MATTGERQQKQVRAEPNEVARWEEAFQASEHDSFNAWAAAALTAQAEQELNPQAPAPTRAGATGKSGSSGHMADRQKAARCSRRRQHRSGETCPECGITF